MKHFMIEVQRDGNFFVAQCLEEESCFTQGRTLQETIRNMREVLELMLDVKGPQLEVRLRHDAVEVFV
jgi:predicted RNase H-like HicB family nuclease